MSSVTDLLLCITSYGTRRFSSVDDGVIGLLLRSTSIGGCVIDLWLCTSSISTGQVSSVVDDGVIDLCSTSIGTEHLSSSVNGVLDMRQSVR